MWFMSNIFAIRYEILGLLAKKMSQCQLGFCNKCTSSMEMWFMSNSFAIRYEILGLLACS